MPELFVITGANGAGKSTLSQALLPENLQDLTVFDGDKFFVHKLSEIFPAINKSPKYAREMAFNETVSYFESLVENAIQNQESFAYEGHFSSPSPWQTIKRFRENGYHITMIFLMLADVSISMQRVTERVKTGGHYVSPLEIEKNYFGNLIQLNNHFQLLDDLYIFDTSASIFQQQILFYSSSEIVEILPKNNLPRWFTIFLSKLAL